MMTGDAPIVPITTLAGIQSLTDLRLELPLPTPLPGVTGHPSLLSHLRDSEEAKRLLNTQESLLIAPLIDALGCTSIDHIEVKDSYDEGSHSGQISQLVKYLLGTSPGVFKGSVQGAYQSAENHGPPGQWMQCNSQSFAASAVPSSQSRTAHDSSPNCIPPIPEGVTIVQNKTAVPPKSPAVAYSPFPIHSTTSPDEYPIASLHHTFSQGTPDSLYSGLQDSPQVFNSPLVHQNSADVPQSSSSVHLFDNGNCIDLAAETSLTNDCTENHTLHLVPEIGSLACDSSAPMPPNNLTFLSSSLMPLEQTSPSTALAEATQLHMDCLEDPVLGDWQPHAPSCGNSGTKPDEQGIDIPVTGSNGQLPIVPVSKFVQENQSLSNLQDKKKSIVSDEALKCAIEPVVVLTKLGVEEQLEPQSLPGTKSAQEPVSHLDCKEENKDLAAAETLKCAIAPVVVLTKLSAKDQPQPTNRHVSKSVHGSRRVSHSESKKKRKDAVIRDEKLKCAMEPVVVLTKLSVKDQVLAQKSVRQFIKAKKIFSPTKQTSPCKTEPSWLKSSTCKDANNKSSPLKKGKNSDCFSTPHKNLEIQSKRGTKRNINDFEDKVNSEGSRKKRRQHSTSVESLESNSKDDSYSEKPVAKVKKSKNRKEESLSVEDLMDSNTYQRFSRLVDAIFDSMEDVDFSTVMDEDGECPAEALIPQGQLQDLTSESAKLKRLRAMSQFPIERLVHLLVILERNIYDGAKLLPMQAMEEQDDDETKLWLELTTERVMRSADASLTALYVMTSPKMSGKVFLENVIERIVLFLKYQLQNTIFPIFDPAYRLDPKSKDGYAGNTKQKRVHSHKVKEKSTLQLYNKLHEAVSLLAELLELQTLTDTIILQVSTLGVSPFFVEGISELQLNALRLVTTVFSRYDKHRQLIMEDILASIARLPTSKRSLRSYRLNSEENIQMLTALILQLIHSVVKLPDCPTNEESSENSEAKDVTLIDRDVLITTSYEASMSTAYSFLTVFLKKCSTKNEEMDYRPLFENFVQDLLSTVNKPEWPASELLLSVLGRILVRNFSNKSMEMALRVASLDYLGLVAARLRKDSVTSHNRKDMIKDVIRRIVSKREDEISPSKKKKKKPVKRDEVQLLQTALLQYLDFNATSDPALKFSRKFYIAQWYRDAATMSQKSSNSPKEETEKGEQTVHSSKVKSSRSSRKGSSHEEEEEEQTVHNSKVKGGRSSRKGSSHEEEEEEAQLESDELNVKALAQAEERKRFLLSVIKKQPTKVGVKEEEHIDYTAAELIAQYLASNRHFSKSFDLYLSQILCVLGETAVAVRTKAMKCLTLVVEADPSILSRSDMQKGVHGRLLDHSTSVREAAVDLLGKFILICPDLISQYYDMLTDRILDTGVSVRKRVIKILKDICLEQPDFPKTSEICVKIIRRVNDEDGIKKLVIDVFQSMWFTPTSEKKPERILQKVKNITHVVEACRDTGLEWFEQLLTDLLKNKDDGHYKSVIKSCKQIINCLVENLLQLEESSQNLDDGTSPHLVACLGTLHLFSKIYPPFVVPHATTIQPYLSMRCNTQLDFLLLKNVAQTLELVIPLIEHPSESFLAQVEEDMVKLILQQHMKLLPSCVSCLGSVVNRVTHNYQLVRDCFKNFFLVLSRCQKEYEKTSNEKNIRAIRPKLLRSLFTVGLFCQHFNFDALDSDQDGALKSKVFEGIIYFNQYEDEAIRLKALTGLGFMMIRHYEFMLGPEVKTLYHYLLTSPVSSSMLKCQVLKNVTNYLIEEEASMVQKDSEWCKMSKTENLKEMGDVTSGMASTIIQLYLKQMLECVLHIDVSVRKASLQVIQLILSQGLVHPVQIVPYLVCLGSDDDPVIRTKADQSLQEIEKKYPGYIQMKAIVGVRMSFKMQQVIQDNSELLRGVRSPDAPISRNGSLYSVMRTTRQSRRAFLSSLLKLFDELARTPLGELLYIADNIAYFPYMAQDEPLFIIHQLDLKLSVSGSNLLQTFREGLLNRQVTHISEEERVANNVDDYDEDEDDEASVLQRLPEDTSILQECILASQGCVLLLYLKQTLKEMYGFTDNKIQQYSPNEAAKVYERPVNRKVQIRFNPETVLEFMRRELLELEGTLDEEGKHQLVQQYVHFKQLMLTIDPSEDDVEDGQAVAPTGTNPTANEGTDKPPLEKVRMPIEKTKVVISKATKSPSRGRPSLKKSPKTPKGKVKKKHKKKRRRILDSASDSGSDPDYMDSS